jgi:energy-coupling factor transporter ATP-binding protein EcfA2
MQPAVCDALKAVTKYCPSYEDGEKHFRDAASTVVPRTYLGPTIFFSDFQKAISQDPLPSFKAIITSNPFDCLAFTTPRQVLFAAAVSSGSCIPEELVDRTANLFGITDLLHQPIQTLSGGETVKLSLAKAYIYRNEGEKFVICGPFGWLSENNVVHLMRVVESYLEFKQPVQLISLVGQDIYQPFKLDEVSFTDRTIFRLTTQNLEIILDHTFLPNDEPSVAAVEEFSDELYSPCCVVGENGSGKSLLGKALSGAIACNGMALLERDGTVGRARLVTQDVLNQVLGRALFEILNSEPQAKLDDALKVYEQLVGAFRTFYKSRNRLVPLIGPELIQLPKGPVEQSFLKVYPTLLQLKLALVASRIASKPVAICIDEPEWGLARDTTAGFVSATVQVAHGFGIAVLITSNKPWWDLVAASKLHVERTSKIVDSRVRFVINLKANKAYD